MTYEEAAGIMRQLISQAIVLGRASGKPTLDRIRIEAICKAVEALEKQTTADAVPVVRCRNCRHLYDGIDDYCCMNHKGLAKICENSFCSYGERKDGAD